MGREIYVSCIRGTFCYLDRVAGKNLLLFVESKSSISKLWNLRDVKNADSDRMLDVLLVINSRISSFYKMLRKIYKFSKRLFLMFFERYSI